jgi:hypothetical protein
MSTADTQHRQATCKERVRSHYQSRMTDLAELWHAATNAGEPCRVCKATGKIGKYDCEYCDGGTYPEDSRLNEYGLSFDYVAPGTFNGQRRGYWRYHLSCGGPSDEFRFYCDERRTPVRIEYWFLDWFDGAKVTVKPESANWATLMELWEDWDGMGMVDDEYARAWGAA